MAITTTGTVSISEIQSEFGGASPVAISQYYRGGDRVPSTKETTSTSIGAWSSFEYQPFSGTPRYFYENSGPIRWDDQLVRSSSTVEFGSYLSGGFRYERGSLQGSGQYSVRRRTESTTTTTTDVNQSVPTGGEVSFSDYYGAEN